MAQGTEGREEDCSCYLLWEKARGELCNGMLSLATLGRAPPIPSKAVKESGKYMDMRVFFGGDLK